jgi:hypothetical protein
MQENRRVVVWRADVGGGDPGFDSLPRHVWLRGHEEGQGGAQAREA